MDVVKSDLEKYAGEYEVSGITVKVYIRGENTLMVLVPGQPDYELTPTRPLEFDFKALKGYSIKFETNEEGKIIALNFVQPNGTFRAVKK